MIYYKKQTIIGLNVINSIEKKLITIDKKLKKENQRTLLQILEKIMENEEKINNDEISHINNLFKKNLKEKQEKFSEFNKNHNSIDTTIKNKRTSICISIFLKYILERGNNISKKEQEVFEKEINDTFITDLCIGEKINNIYKNNIYKEISKLILLLLKSKIEGTKQISIIYNTVKIYNKITFQDFSKYIIEYNDEFLSTKEEDEKIEIKNICEWIIYFISN